MFNTKKPIREFGKLYEYLIDHNLRIRERGTGHLYIEDADFTEIGQEFINATWYRIVFKRCHFPASYLIQLQETTDCMFMYCEFGPGRLDVALSFGKMKNGMFQHCKFTNGSVSSGEGNTTFQKCEFENSVISDSNKRSYTLAGDTLLLEDCKLKDFELLCDDTKLHMKRCEYKAIGYGKAGSISNRYTKPYTADFIFENTSLQVAELILWGSKINNLTLRGCKTKGTFSTQQSSIKESITLENLKVGAYFIAQTGTEKRITIRECNFSELVNDTDRLFYCSGDYANEFLMERVESSNAGAVNLTGAGPKTTEKARLAVTRNQTFTLRNCKIPHLMVHCLQSHNLVIENCEFGKLEIPNGRIGNVTIKNTKFDSLDLTNTLATKFEIDSASAASGKIVTAGSNYPQGGYKIDGVSKG